MVTIAHESVRVSPDTVHSSLARHMLADGFEFVLDLRKSHGVWLVDARNGREYLDFFSNFASSPLGFRHPKLEDPEFRQRLLDAAIDKPANSDLYTTAMAEFVETVAKIVPDSHNSHLFFVEGGGLGVENALKTAFDWKVRKNFRRGYRVERGHKVLHLEQAFHGRGGYGLSLTNTADPRKTQYFPKFEWPRVVNPKLTFPVTPEVMREVEEREALAERQIRMACETYRDDIAALILEPIQGEGGDNHFRPEFFQRLRRLADELEFLLIMDEVQTGVGMTGTMWAWQQTPVAPDIFCFGKKMQLGGLASNRRIDDEENVFKVASRINSTWGGNLVDMVRSTRYLEVIEEDALVENARQVGAALLRELESLAQEFPGRVTNVRGKGLFIAFDLADSATRDRALQAAREEGLLLLASGHRAVRFRPALILTTEEASEGVRRIRRALARIGAVA